MSHACYFCIFFIQQPQTGQQPAVQATTTPATTTTTTTAMPKEQETVADPNAEEDIFAKFEDTPSPAANQVYMASCIRERLKPNNLYY